MRWSLRFIDLGRRKRVITIVLILALSFTVRALTAQFIAAHLDNPGWFQPGSYAIFDRQARAILDGTESFFLIKDPTRTDLAQHPPGYKLWVALIYSVSGEWSARSVQRVQWILDSLSVLLVAGIGVTAYGWRAGMAAGALAALSPLLALSGATPLSDAVACWPVLGGVWMLILSAKRESLGWAIGAGVMLGVACWLRVNPLYLSVAWALALLLLMRVAWPRRLLLSAAVVASTGVIIAPVVIRNLVTFYPEFVYTGSSVGTNLWEGIGETERGRTEFGAPANDWQIVEQERRELGLPPEAPLALHWPDGIRRDSERRRKAMAVIRAHPVWFAGVCLRRMAGMLKYAGEPLPWHGSAGVNVTSRKCLPPQWQGGVAAFFVNGLGILQSIVRYLALPLMLAGVWLGFRRNRLRTVLLLTTVVYYLLTLSIGHSELRYGLPMHAVLFVFAGLTICELLDMAFKRSALRSDAAVSTREDSCVVD